MTGERRDEDYFRNLVYGKFNRRRFTQDSPILLDVYSAFGCSPGEREDLLLTPDWSKTPGDLSFELAKSFGIAQQTAKSGAAASASRKQEQELSIAFNQSVVAIKLTFRELVGHVLPLSWWWNKWLTLGAAPPQTLFTNDRTKAVAREQLIAGLQVLIAQQNALTDRQHSMAQPPANWLFRDDLVWAAHLFFIIEHSNRVEERPGDAARPKMLADAAANAPKVIADWFIELLSGITAERSYQSEKPWVFSVNRNRPIHLSTRHSIPATKADVVRRTFDIGGEGITWAVIDSGIDATHVAFRRSNEGGLPFGTPFGGGQNHTRIKATYDFSHIRDELSQHQRQSFGSPTGRMIDWEKLEAEMQAAATKAAEEGKPARPLRIPHDEAYRVPSTSHGTHVAGILAADWDPSLDDDDPVGPPTPRTRLNSPIRGMCPKIELYDLRVFDGTEGDEFAVMSALQFVRHLNQRQDTPEIHGVNMSLAVIHDVANYACGSSPVCEESSRLISNGVVVVAAAGNSGRAVYTSTQGIAESGYRTVSIADPGNAEAVITVGATHRQSPHLYGVSYFSSRGPTGDGRMKPDLVAPGEKVYSTVPGDRAERQDGTSQAAPHVSGAAALLMCRHRELIGNPNRVKQILKDTATDLGREPTYQGAGLVDVMRAIQSF